MKQKVLFLITLLMLTCVSISIFGQDKTNNKFGKGIKIVAQDSSFAMKFSARFQTLYIGVLDIDTKEYADKFLIRRARLKFDGFAYSPKLSYKIELGLSNRDIGGNIAQTSNASNIVLDAVLKYNFYKNWSVWIGQTKLPGNIERVISSSSLQFVDRSNLNSRYNIDRDAGIQLHYDGSKIRMIGAITTGEGRNITIDNAGGYDYTGRIEWLPFGAFAGGGDYKASDMKREQSPRLMLGFTYDYNDRASRTGGQLGKFLTEQRTLKSIFLDAHLKYNGLSVMAEYIDKKALGSAAILESGTGNFIESYYVGTGTNVQAGYLFKNNWEIAGRYTEVNPTAETQKNRNQQYTFGLSRYIVGHAFKVQTDATLIQEAGKSDQFVYRFQIEFGF